MGDNLLLILNWFWDGWYPCARLWLFLTINNVVICRVRKGSTGSIVGPEGGAAALVVVPFPSSSYWKVIVIVIVVVLVVVVWNRLPTRSPWNGCAFTF